MKTVLSKAIYLIAGVAVVAVLLIGSVQLFQPKKKTYSLTDAFGSPGPPLYKYYLFDIFTPLKHFLPKDKNDWNLNYLVQHPKNVAVGFYLIENHYYHGGIPEAKQFLCNLFDIDSSPNEGELRFDAYLLSTFFPPLDNIVFQTKQGRINFEKRFYTRYFSHASLSQAYCLFFIPDNFKTNYEAYKYALSSYPNDSYFVAHAALFCAMYQTDIKYNSRWAKPDPISDKYLTKANEIKLYNRAIELDPTNIGAYSSLESDYAVSNDFKKGIELAKKERLEYVKLGLPEHSPYWAEIDYQINWCKHGLDTNWPEPPTPKWPSDPVTFGKT